MKRIIFALLIVIAGLSVYYSCSDETSKPEDASGTQDVLARDVVEIKDEVVQSDAEKDTIEIQDNEVKDEMGEDIQSDIVSVEEVKDTGVEVEDVITDINPTPPAKIIPGAGIDITYNSQPRQIRIGDSYGTLKDITMSVPDPRVPYYLRVDSMHFDLLFGDTDGSKALSDNDKLIRIILSKDFNGETDGKTKAGDPLSKAKAEFGESDYSTTTNVEGTDYTFDFYFKKGVNVGSDKNQIITGFTIYNPQKVIPSDVIDYENSKVLGITADIGFGISNATSISEMRNILGPEDLMVEDNTNKLIYYNYISIGFTAIDTQSSSGDVKTITLFAPYFGKIKGSNSKLGLGSSKQDIDAFFSPKYGAAKTLQQGDTTIYYYVIKQKNVFTKKYNICIGFIYNQNDKAIAILVGLPVEQK
ncbi:MAG: hypothetical protein ACP5QK_13130 [Myxococcota bacterium]